MRAIVVALLCAGLALGPTACAERQAAYSTVEEESAADAGSDTAPESVGGLTRNQKIAAGTAVGAVGIGVLSYLALTAVAATLLLSGAGG